jgi:type II secretory pathway pseudopilin PulG
MQALKCDCAEPLQVADRYIGKRVQCPACRTVLVVPERNGDQGSALTGIKASPRQPVLLTEQAPQDDNSRWWLDGQPEDPASLLDGRRFWMFALVGLLLFGVVVAAIVIRANESLEQGKVDAVRAQMRVIATALEEHRLSHGVWPEKLEILFDDEPARGGAPYFKGIKTITDAWGKIYGYDPDDPQGPLLFCTTPGGLLLTQRVRSGQP